MSQPTRTQVWSIVVAGGEGDEATIQLNEHEHLRELLRMGLHALYGEPVRNPADYDVLIAGTPQDDLSLTLIEAGLADEAEVVILPKDVSRGRLDG